MELVAVIDFETTGLSPGMGDRATEIAAVLVRDGVVVDRYQSLMNANVFISSFIEDLTGISNEMIQKAPKADKVMREVATFVGKHPLVAHNASFDRGFWDAELHRIGKSRVQEFVCSMRVARRLFPNSPNHKLGTLIDYLNLPVAGRSHRALADAEMATSLLLTMEDELSSHHRICDVSHDLLLKIQSVPRNQLKRVLQRRRNE